MALELTASCLLSELALEKGRCGGRYTGAATQLHVMHHELWSTSKAGAPSRASRSPHFGAVFTHKGLAPWRPAV
jgi:hypothetical protein